MIFNSDYHHDDILKVLNKFIQAFELKYAAAFPDCKIFLNIAIEGWKLASLEKSLVLAWRQRYFLFWPYSVLAYSFAACIVN